MVVDESIQGVLAQGIISLYLLRVYAWMEPPAW